MPSTATLTDADCNAIRDALVQQIEASKVEHRERLLRGTHNDTRSFQNDVLRIGSWVVQAEGDHYRLMQRMGPHPVALFYAANARRENGRWTVYSFGPGWIHWASP